MSEQPRPEDEGRYSRDEAIEEAMISQNLLYDWKANHLRDAVAFKPEEYEGIDRTIEYIKNVADEVRQVPNEQPARSAFIESLLNKYPPGGILRAWQYVLLKDFPRSNDLKKFAAYSAPLFYESNREYFDAENEHETGRYNYGSASGFYLVLAHQMYQEISGQPYLSPQELRYNFEKALDGKQILELAPGPGWFMKILRNMNANVIGLEKNPQESFKGVGMMPYIGKGDATELEWMFEKDKFDIIISNNLFNITEKNDAAQILTQTLKVLKEGGKAVHAAQDFQYPREYFIIQQMMRDPKHINQYLDLLPQVDTPRVDAMFKGFHDAPSVRAEDAIRAGAKNVCDGREDGYYYLSYTK